MTDLPAVLGVDIGTSSSKGLLVSATGTVLARVDRPHRMNSPRPGWAEMDATSTWWEEFAQICRDLTDAANTSGHQVLSICVSGIGPCLALTDDHGVPMRPALLYGIDMRATREIDELNGELGADRIMLRCGTSLSSQAIGPKMRWVARHEPQVWSRASRWYNSSSYVVGRLTGEYVLDHHTASQCDPLYDMLTGDWATDWYDLIAPGLRLPELYWPGEVVGRVHAEAARQTGLPVGTAVCAGTVDAWAEAYSVGVYQPGDLMLMYGSTMFFVQMTSDMRRHELLWSTRGVEPGSYSLAAGMSTSGTLARWVRDITGADSFASLESQAAKVPPGAGGLLVLPYFAGERTPVFDPHARGVVVGLHLGHGPGHLLRAAYEGVAFGVRQNIALLDQVAGAARRVVAVGGGTTGSLWTQIVSDVTHRDQIECSNSVGASLGDARLAAQALGLVDHTVDWNPPMRTVRPRPETYEVYDGLFVQYASLYPATKDIAHALARVQSSAAE